MKRLQILIDENLDNELKRLAAEQGISKAALIRQLMGELSHPLPPLADDPLFQMVGADDFEPAPLDVVVYE